MPADPQKARELFMHAVGKLPPEEWTDYVAGACGGDTELEQQVKHLLALHRDAGSFLEGPAPLLETLGIPNPPANGAVAECPGSEIGSYKLLEQIGEGGFGIVFMAEQQQPVRRKVALKVLKPGMDTRQVIARFEAERQALALMDHPNIAQVFDGGETPTGRPYFVMELVRGIPITEFCDENKWSIRERFGLFRDVCRAVQHAHQKGIIHRDLKPSNIMVTLHDDRPVVKVIDFGVAKATGAQLTEKTLFTNFAQMIGTPLYMSPEQTQMSGLDVDTRSDIYSLGVLLYELLTGTTPFDRERFKTVGYDEIRRIIREEEPPKPSTRLSTVGQASTTISARRRTDPIRLGRLLRGDLDWIVMKALEKDRNRRYQTAAAFEADVERYLKDEAVEACPPSRWYRFRRFVRRNRGPVTAGALVLLTLVAGVVGTTLGMIQAQVARVDAEEAAEAEAAAHKAEARRRRQTREALDAMSSQVIEEWLGKQKELLPEHKAFLEKALTSYEEFAQDTGNDEQVRAGAAAASLRVGHICARLGQTAKAEAAYHRSQQLYGALAIDFPAQPDYRWKLAQSHVLPGPLLRELGRLREAETAYRDALVIHKQLAAEWPNRAEYRSDLAGNYNSLGWFLANAGRHKEAETAYREAIGLQTKLIADFPIPAHREELAVTYNNLGLLLKKTGRLKQAQTALGEAVAVFKQLSADFPKHTGYRDDLAMGHTNLAGLFWNNARPKEAEAACRAGLGLYRQLAAEFPARPDYRWNLAGSYNNLGNILKGSGRHKEAEASYHDALTLYKQLAEDFPGQPDYRWKLATGRLNLGALLFVSKRLKEAEAPYRQAVTVLTQLSADFPGRPEYQFAVGQTYYNLGLLLMNSARPKEAEKAFRDARERHKKLSAHFPTVPDYQNELATTLTALGLLANSQQQHVQACRYLEAAVPHHQAVVAANPREMRYRQHFSSNQMAMAEARLKLGEYAAAAAVAEQIAREPLSDNYNAACYLARCAPLVEKDVKLPEAKRLDLSRAYADRAMHFLQQAVEKGFKDAALIKKDNDLDGLRAREDFKRLLAKLKKEQAKSGSTNNNLPKKAD